MNINPPIEWEQENLSNSCMSQLNSTGFYSIAGLNNRINTIYLSYGHENVQNVIYFPGDVQQSQASMRRSQYNCFSDYSYESMISILKSKFLKSNIWIISPSFMEEGHSFYEHFVTIDAYGDAIKYDPNEHACAHLIQLMQNMEIEWKKTYDISLSIDLPISLIGFSKGVIVLSQILTELACSQDQIHLSTSNSPNVSLIPTSQLFSKIISIHWIDGGNGRRPHVYPTNALSLNILSKLSITMCFHMTPYQMCAPSRPWCRSEVEQFIDSLKDLEMKNVFFKGYFMQISPSLDKHFQVLKEFDQDFVKTTTI